MKKITFVIILTCAFFISFCSTGSKTSSNSKGKVTVDFPSDGDLNQITKDNHLTLNEDALIVPEEIVVKSEEDPCDGSDNDKDGKFDEYCYECCKTAARGDFDCNGVINNYDCNATILVAYNATIFKGLPTCVDLDGNGQVDMADTIKCLEMVKEFNKSQ